MWDPSLEEWRDRSPRFVAKTLVIPPPPSNHSPTTKRELAYLHDQYKKRTTEKLQRIEDEIYLLNQTYAGESLAERIKHKPQTRELVIELNDDLTIHVLQLKQYFDRVRPSYLDPSLSTTITVPEHPAYPSGHATQAYFFAYLFSELDPQNEAAYLQSAAEIAQNREIAGVHYPSDSLAGEILAQQYFFSLQESDLYQKKLAATRAEWR